MRRDRLIALWICWVGMSGSVARAADRALPPRVENVIVVTIDGFRSEELFGGAQAELIDKKAGGVSDVEGLTGRFGQGSPEARRATLMPFVWGTIAREGQIFGDRSQAAGTLLTNGKKFSYPGYNELFCGFGDDRIDSNGKVTNPNPSVLEYLNNQPEFRGKVAAYCTWDVFPSILRSDQNGLKIHTAYDLIVDPPLTPRQQVLNEMVATLPRYWSDNVYDAITLGSAREYLTRHKPRVLYIGLGETDEWAHGRRYDLYLEAAHITDRYLADLWQTIQTMPDYAGKTALILTTDHGRGVTPSDWTSHGVKTEGAENIWIALLAPGVTPALGVRSNVATTQSQVAATIAHLVGANFNELSPRAAPPLPGILASESPTGP